MATNTAVVAAPRSVVWAVLADGWTFSNWVVGASHVRAVDAAWPNRGAKIFHATGPWPLMLRDETEVVAVETGRRLELVARGRPFGTASIVLEFDDESAGCRVTMHERPTAGPGRWFHNPATEAVLVRRNTESLARLAALCERRTEPSE